MKPLREGAMVLGLALGGRILGFGRTVLTAAVAGAGPAADAFFVAFRIVGLLRAVMGGGLNAAFVPLFVRLTGNGRGRARAFSADALATTGAAAAAVAAIAAIAMPWAVQVSAPGLPDGTGPPAVPGLPDDLARSVTFARIMLPCLVFGALALVLRAVLNGLGRHGAGAAMPAAFNLAAIASLLTLEPLLPGPLHSLAAGIALGGAAQLALVAAACRRAGFAVPPALPRLRPETRTLFLRAAPAALGAGAVQATLLVDAGVASMLGPGAVSHLDYAARVTRLVPGLVGAAAATVLLPMLARAGGSAGSAVSNRTLEAVMLLGMPAAAALAVLAEPVTAALFRHGAFTAADAAATAEAMAAYAWALPAWVSAAVLANGFFAGGDTVTPTVLAAAGVAANLGLSLLLMEPLGHGGVALGTAAAAWLQCLGLCAVLMRRGVFRPDARLLRRVPAMAAASGAMALVLWLALPAPTAILHAGAWERGIVLAGLVALGFAAFVLFAALTGAARPREIVRAWGHEVPREENQ